MSKQLQSNLTVAHGELHKIDGQSMAELVGRPFTKQPLMPPHYPTATVEYTNNNRLREILLSKKIKNEEKKEDKKPSKFSLRIFNSKTK